MNELFNENDFRGLDLNVLLTFTALMRERSVTRAAARLYLGPSAVSMSLKRLREHFGDPLFVRTRSAMEPTPRALALYECIECALADVHAAVFGAEKFDPARLQRTFRFAAPDDLAMALVPNVFERVRSEASGVKLIIRPSDFRSALQSLDSGDADLALTALPEKLESWHKHEVLYHEAFACVYDPAQIGVSGKLTLKRFIATPQLLLSPRGELHSQIDDLLTARGLQRDVVMAVAQFPLMPFLLRKSPSLVNMPATAARIYAAEFKLTTCPLPLDVPPFPVALLWHARNDMDPALVWFRALVSDELRRLRSLDR